MVGDGEYVFKGLRRHVCHAATKPIGSRAVGANDAQVAAKLNKHHVHTGEENVDVSAQPFFALILAAEPGRQFTILIQRQEHRSWTAVMQDINRPVRASVLPDREVPHDFRGGHALLIALHRRGMGGSPDNLLLVVALSCPAAQRALSYGKQYRERISVG